MTKLFRPITFLAAASAALLLAPRVHAQLETFETLSAYNGGGIEGFTGGNTALTETFTNVLELDSVTYRFTNTAPSTSAQTVDAYLVQWNTATDKPMTSITAPTVGGNSSTDATTTTPLTPLEEFTIPPVGTGAWQSDTFSGGGSYDGYDVTLSLGQLTDPSLTYAIVLIDTTNASGIGLLEDNSRSDAFIYGTAYVIPGGSGGDSTLAAMQNDPFGSETLGSNTDDYGFSQIVVVPAGNVVPVPEPRTAAAIICALFVAGLVGRQLLLRRKDEVAVAGMAA